MANMEKPPTAQIRADDITVFEGAEDLARQSDMTIEQATKLVDMVNFRAGNRSSGRLDLIIKISDWLAWKNSEDNQPETEYMLVYGIEDYSAKAYKVEGASYVDADFMADDSRMFGADDESISSLLSRHTNKHTEYDVDEGTTWLAKSQTEGIYALKWTDQ